MGEVGNAEVGDRFVLEDPFVGQFGYLFVEDVIVLAVEENYGGFAQIG